MLRKLLYYNRIVLFIIALCTILFVGCKEEYDDVPLFDVEAEVFAENFMWDGCDVISLKAYYYNSKYYYEVNLTFKEKEYTEIYILQGFLIDSFGLTDEAISLHQNSYSAYLIAKEKGKSYKYSKTEIDNMSKLYKNKN